MDTPLISKRGKEKFTADGYVYNFHKNSGDGETKFWQCEKKITCRARVHTKDGEIVKRLNEHSHDPTPLEVIVAKATAISRRQQRAMQKLERASQVQRANEQSRDPSSANVDATGPTPVVGTKRPAKRPAQRMSEQPGDPSAADASVAVPAVTPKRRAAQQDDFNEILSKILPKSYASLAGQATKTREKLIKDLLYHKKMPENGWDELSIEYFVNRISALDSNNYLSNVGIGEREGRVFSDLVRRRHFRMSHGIGRSGDVKAVQPKAAGSSLVNVLTNSLALHAVQLSGVKNCKNCFVLPTSTGMALSLCLLYARQLKPLAMYVIWSRIDQKSCFKAILTAGFVPIIIDLKPNEDELVTDLYAIEKAIYEYGAESIACVYTTTSCFAPRVPDDIISVAKLCKRYGLFHLINNAYGLQCDSICNKIEEASRAGRIDAFVQSTDKNFMVPVGGSIIAGFDSNLIDSIGQLYPGRASSGPSLDLLITLLSMGVPGYQRLRAERKEKFEEFMQILEPIAFKYNERLLNTKKNTISIAFSLSSLDQKYASGGKDQITKLGSMLFTRQCSGARVVLKHQTKSVENYEFKGWMSHFPYYHWSYLNVAAAIGMKSSEIDRFVQILDECLSDIMKNEE